MYWCPEAQPKSFSVLGNTGLPGFICRFLHSFFSDSITHFLMDRGVRHGCPASRFPLQWRSTRSSGCKRQSSQERWQLVFVEACPMRLRWRSRCCIVLLSGLDDCASTNISFCGLHCWNQFELIQMVLGSVRHRSRMRTRQSDAQDWEPCPCSVEQLARTKLYRLPFLELAPYVVLVLI